MPADDFIEKHAQRVGIDPKWLRKIMQVESGGNPSASTGSYKGLFQLSREEFRRGGGSGDIMDPEQNTMAAANKIAREKLQFQRRYSRDPTLADIYMIHQQGEAGYAAHMANPDAPAWQNMMKASGKGEAWAKRAIWGNMTDSMKAKYGSVDNVTSAAFTGDWSGRIEGASPSVAMARSRARRGGIPEKTGELTVDQQNPWKEGFVAPPPAPDPPPVTVNLNLQDPTPTFSVGKTSATTT